MPEKDDLIAIRCKICNKIICEVSAETTGKIRIKCHKGCRQYRTLSLPLNSAKDVVIVNSQIEASGKVAYA